MATEVIVGDTTRITVTFRDWSTDTEEGGPTDPNGVSGTILDSIAGATPMSFTPTRSGTGTYQFDWTPTIPDLYTVTFTGLWSDGTSDVITEQFNVVSTPTVSSGVSLESDYVITFTTDLTPMYVDPDEVQSIYADASPVDIAEYLKRGSEELDFIHTKVGKTIPEPYTPSPVELDYVRAYALCQLTRIYEPNAGQSSRMQLGDLTIEQSSGSKKILSAGNATTWCELAMALRSELLGQSGISGYRATQARGLGNEIPYPFISRRILNPYR